MIQHTAVMGAGMSGRAARALALQLGHRVTLFDQTGMGDREEFGPEDLLVFDQFVFSPGFAASHAWRVLVESSERRCYGELGFGALHWPGRLIGVTGTNGKTSLTQLLTAAFSASGESAYAAGNIGQPLSGLCLDNSSLGPEPLAVCEISSFQAELCEGLRLDGLVWTNFAEDHLDRYPSLEAYFRAKARLFGRVKPGAPVVLGADVAAMAQHCRLPLPVQAQVLESERAEQASNKLPEVSPFCNFPQSQNFAQAVAFAEAWGLDSRFVRAAAANFQLAPHRLALVATCGSARFWNDSKATNFHAALAAMEAVPRPIHWIGGGVSKGGDLEAFARAIAGKVDAAYVYGAVGEHLTEALRPHLDKVFYARKLGTCLAMAFNGSRSASSCNVLFSPAFASFDQFANYAVRGKFFISKVLSLKGVEV